MKTIINNFFAMGKCVDCVSEDDYKQVMPLVAAFEASARLTYQSFYIIDFHKRGLLYVSGNPFFLCGLSPFEITERGLMYHLERIPEEEHDMLLDIGRAGFAFLDRTPVEDRLKLSFSCDFHIRNGNKPVLINHKLTPIGLSDGNMWLGGCAVSHSFRRNPGYIEVRIMGEAGYWDYSLTRHQWTWKDEIVLKDREKEILLLSAQGLTMTHIADQLHIGIDTVKSHKQRLFQKLDANNISAALGVATGYKLI